MNVRSSVPVKFHLDECLFKAKAVARILRQAGVDVTTTTQTRLRTRPDEDHFLYAIKESRILVTQDADFLSLARHIGDHPGLVYYAPNTRTVGQIVKSLLLIYEVLSVEDMVGRVEYL